MTQQPAEMRPQISDAQRAAAETYRRRRARSAADMLLEIPPADWDDHTKRVVLVTLPSLIYAQELAKYGEPQPHLTCPLSTCTKDADHDGPHDPFPAVRAPEPWCDGQLGYGVRCGLPSGHMGECDPDVTDPPPADYDQLYPCQPIGCDAGWHLPGCRFARVDAR